MDGSPLNDIPAELRNRIYELALVLDGSVVLYYYGLSPKMPFPRCRQQQVREAMSLLSSCKQVRQEALPVFYGGNLFQMYIWSLFQDDGPQDVAQVPCIITSINQWLQRLGPSTAKHIRNFKAISGTPCFFYDGIVDNDYVIRLVPILLDRLRTVLAGTQARPIFCLEAQWCPYEEETVNDAHEVWEGENVTLSFQDAPSARKAYGSVFLDDEIMVEESWGVWEDSGKVARPSARLVASRHKGLRNTRLAIEMLIAELDGVKQQPHASFPDRWLAKAFKKIGA